MYKNKKTIVIYVLLIFQAFLLIYYNKTGNIPNFQRGLYILVIGFTTLLSLVLGRNEKIRIKKLDDKLKAVIIGLMLYYIIYFLFGLVFGYALSPYSNSIKSLSNNFYMLILPLLLIEIVRFELIKQSKKNLLSLTIINVVFLLVNIDLYLLISNSLSVEAFIKNGFEFIIPITLTSFLLTYLAYNGGKKLTFTFILLYNLPIIFLPIFPSLNWFVAFVLKTALIIGIFFSVSLYQNNKIIREKKRETVKNFKFNMVFLVIIILFVMFVVGVFNKMPIAVMSNSMYPMFSRGDIIVIDKVSNETVLNETDIIMYQLEKSFVVHRIVEIMDTPYGLVYMTKGDNNEGVDIYPVEMAQIKGVVKFNVKYIGFPSVWISELLNKPIANVEKGDL